VTDVRLSIAIQHHPNRAHLLDALAAGIKTDCDVVVDPDPDNEFRSAWRSYKLALELTPEWATHRVIVQDDALPCSDFALKLLARVMERPDRLIALFLAGFPVKTAKKAREAMWCGERWADFQPNDFVGTVGLVWPVDLIPRFLEFCEGRFKPFHGGDDGKVAEFVKHERITACTTGPSLLQHPDDGPSVYLRFRQANAGKRTALFFDEG